MLTNKTKKIRGEKADIDLYLITLFCAGDGWYSRPLMPGMLNAVLKAGAFREKYRPHVCFLPSLPWARQKKLLPGLKELQKQFTEFLKGPDMVILDFNFLLGKAGRLKSFKQFAVDPQESFGSTLRFAVDPQESFGSTLRFVVDPQKSFGSTLRFAVDPQKSFGSTLRFAVDPQKSFKNTLRFAVDLQKSFKSTLRFAVDPQKSFLPPSGKFLP